MKSEEILKIASKLVSGDRAKAYGDKKKLHDKTAKMWSAFIHAEQVAHMMVMLKIARTTTGNNPDNYVDAAAYSAIAGEINDHNKNK